MSDIIYYNIVMTGDRLANKTLAEFEETRTQALINKPDDYYMSVVRFSLDGSWIPLLICPVVVNPFNPNDVNTTPYEISITYGALEFSVPLVYIPESNSPLPKPPTNINSQDTSTDYYFIYSYETFVTMINKAIDKLYNGYTDPFINPIFPNHVNGLFDLVPGLNATPIPYIIYDSETQKFSFIIPNIPNPLVPGTNLYTTQYDTNNIPVINVVDSIKIFLNGNLIALIDGFEYFTYDGSFIPSSNMEVLLLVKDYKNNYYYPPQNAANTAPPQVETSFSITAGPQTDTYTAAPIWFKLTQQYKTISLFNSLSSIVFKTMGIPVQREFIPTSSIVGSANNVSGNVGFDSILTDFVPVLSESGDVRTRLVYNPTAQFRLISLISPNPLFRIDIKAYWQDQYQNLYPLYISYNESDSIKLMFIKKSLANNSSKYY